MFCSHLNGSTAESLTQFRFLFWLVWTGTNR